MWPRRYFPARYFAPRYWPSGVEEELPPDHEGQEATLRRSVGHYTLRRGAGMALLRPPDFGARE